MNFESIISYINKLLQNNTSQLTSVDNEFPKNLENIITFLKENENQTAINSLKDKIEEYKKLQISKDNEIARLNDINISKQNEIEKYKKLVNDQKNGTREKELEEEFKKEKEKYNAKINDLELKVYNLNEEKNKKEQENKNMKDKLNELLKEKEEQEKLKNEEKKEEKIEEEKKDEKKIEEEKKEEEKVEEKNELENNIVNDKLDDNNNDKIKDNETNTEPKVELIEKVDTDNNNTNKTNDYESLLQEKTKISKDYNILSQEKEKLLADYNILLEEKNKISEELNQMNEENNKLKESVNKYKEELDNKKIFKTNIDIQNYNLTNNSEQENEKELLLSKQKDDEMNQLKQKISQYETGELIPEIIQNKINQEKEELINKLNLEMESKEKEYLKINEDNSKLIKSLNLNIKEKDDKIKMLNENLQQVTSEKKELEEIIIKQEGKVNDLGEKVNQIEVLLKKKNDEIKVNENYSLKLITIIKEQKLKLQTLKKEQKTFTDFSAINENNLGIINSLRSQVESLKKKLVTKDESISSLQKSHKILQDKYFQLTSNNRLKEQEKLLIQAKKMKMEKNEREKEQFIKRNKEIFKSKDKNYSLNNIKKKNIPIETFESKLNEPINKKEDNFATATIGERKVSLKNSQPKTVLPAIKSTKNKERIERLKLKSEDDGKIEQINDMMTKIMDDLD